MKYKNLMFDLDGTLTDPALGITNSIAYALRKMEIPVPPFEVLCRHIGPPLMQSLMYHYGLDENGGKKALELYREYFGDRGIFENAVYTGIPELLCEMKKQGRKIYMATSKPEPYAIRIAEHFGFAKYFDRIAGSTMTEERTKKADVIAYLAELEGFDPADSTLMIGDREHDVLGAKQHGAPCAAVLYGYGSREELAGAGAEYLVGTVAELRALLNADI
ncbi:MAG: HAD family hydrolase [Ruminococcaceae bacterium]|nr:HAD family hydrolase [Oscillospiraceae bacterium]